MNIKHLEHLDYLEHLDCPYKLDNLEHPSSLEHLDHPECPKHLEQLMQVQQVWASKFFSDLLQVDYTCHKWSLCDTCTFLKVLQG